MLDRVPSGSPGVVALRPGASLGDIRSVSASMSLARRGISMLRAKRSLEEMIETGRAVVALPTIEDIAVLTGELSEHGVVATSVASAQIDVKAVREGLRLTQEQFSLRYGLDIDSVQNWEAGRRKPDKAVRSYLRVIERLPAECSAALEDVTPAA